MYLAAILFRDGHEADEKLDREPLRSRVRRVRLKVMGIGVTESAGRIRGGKVVVGHAQRNRSGIGGFERVGKPEIVLVRARTTGRGRIRPPRPDLEPPDAESQRRLHRQGLAKVDAPPHITTYDVRADRHLLAPRRQRDYRYRGNAEENRAKSSGEAVRLGCTAA